MSFISIQLDYTASREKYQNMRNPDRISYVCPRISQVDAARIFDRYFCAVMLIFTNPRVFVTRAHLEICIYIF